MSREEFFSSCGEMGEAQVRALALSWSQPLQGYAFEWLALRASEERARSEASQAEQIALARSATALALQANQIAKTSKAIAIIGSVLSIVIAILSWLLPRG